MCSMDGRRHFDLAMASKRLSDGQLLPYPEIRKVAKLLGHCDMNSINQESTAATDSVSRAGTANSSLLQVSWPRTLEHYPRTATSRLGPAMFVSFASAVNFSLFSEARNIEAICKAKGRTLQYIEGVRNFFSQEIGRVFPLFDCRKYWLVAKRSTKNKGLFNCQIA